jgi:hypothetical protein
MTYVILNGHRGIPCAVFKVERETPKRYYGDLADTISDGTMRNWFWLNGLTKSREPGKSYVDKNIVACMIEHLERWHEVKNRLCEITNDFSDDRTKIEADLNKARQIAIEREVLAREQAERRVDFCLEAIK